MRLRGVGMPYEQPAAPFKPVYEFDPAAGLELMRNPDRGSEPAPRFRPVGGVRRNASRSSRPRGPATLTEAYQQRALLSLIDAASMAGCTVKDLRDAMASRRICETRVDGVVVVRAEEVAKLLGVRGVSRLAMR